MSCPLCDDTGWKPVEEIREGQPPVRRVVRCDCWRDRVSATNLKQANIPRRYEHCTLENLRAYNESLRDAVDAGKRFLRAFPVVERGLLLLGHAGVGKTHIAVGILREAIRTTGVRGLFYDTRELLKTIRSSYDPVVRSSETGIIKPVMEAELLVLDDLGAERPTDWVEEMMNLIVNTRYNEKRITVFTSNYADIPEIENPNSLLCRIGFRMRSRLQEMCTTIEIDAADFRDEHMPENASDQDLVSLWKLKKRPKELPLRANRPARANLRDGRADLKWPGGRAGS